MGNNRKEKLNILLVNPSPKESYGRLKAPVQIHLGLAYLAAMVKEDNVRILDMDADRLTSDNFIKIIKEGKFDLAGFTVTTPTFYSSLKLAKLVKTYSPKTLVIFGGIHPTIRPDEVLSFDCVDLAVRQEGEVTFKEIVDCLKQKKDFFGIAGIAYKENGVIKQNPSRPFINDLDNLPFPARNLFTHKQYTYPDSLYKNTVPMITSRGCPGSCAYCTAYNLFGRGFRARSAENVADEIELLITQWKAKEIHIWDDNFTTQKIRVFEIRDEVLKRNLKVKFAFPNGIRADFLDEEILGALKEMGTYSLAIGVESGSQEILNQNRKGIKLEKIEEAFTLAKKMRLETWAFFMIGLPGENVNTIKQTLNFAQKLDPDIVKFHILKPYPGSAVYEYLQGKNFILTRDYSHFGIHTPPIHRLKDLEPATMLEWQKRAYLSFYFRPKKILQQILRIKTLNRFRLNFQAGLGLVKMILAKNS